MKILGSSRGYTIIELLIGLFLTGIIAASGLSFYTRVHNEILTQESIGDMQQESRNCIDQMAYTIRMAGYKVSGHPPYQINGDSLYVFFSETQAVDSVLYYLEDYRAEYELASLATIPQDRWPRKLMIKRNSDRAHVYADAVTSISYSAPTASTILIGLTAQSSRADEDYARNDGVRTFQCTERVKLRNVGI